MARKRIQKEVELKQGKTWSAYNVRNCRKIFYKCHTGQLLINVEGNISASDAVTAPYSGGVGSPNTGGAYNWKNVKEVRITAVKDSTFYIHIEWTVNNAFGDMFDGVFKISE